jgi:hypothetical protein
VVGLGAGVGDIDGEPFLLKALPESPLQGFVVLNKKKSHSDSPNHGFSRDGNPFLIK